MNNIAHVSFDDLEGDLNEGSNGMPRAERPGTVGWTNPCPKCRGSGRFITYGGRDLGACHMCHGVGTLTFKTSPEQRERARTNSANAKVKKLVANVDSFIAEFPAEHAWLAAASARGFNFATSVLAGVTKFGSLTDNQMAAVRRFMAQDAERTVARAERTETAKGIDVSRIAEMFAKVRATNPIKQPTLLVEGLELQLAKEHSTNPGSVYIRRLADDAYLGKISPEGVYSPSFKATAADLDVVKATAADPLGLATAYGLRTGRCSCCGLKLSNKLSVELGIGPICRSKWGM